MKNFIVFFLLVFFYSITTSVFAQDKASAGGVSLSGWDCIETPIVENPNKETGQIIFAVEIDNAGDVLKVTVLKRTISSELAQKCETEIRKMSFVKKANNTSTSPTAKGTITFVFKVH